MAKEYITQYQEGQFRIMGVQGSGSGLIIYEQLVPRVRGENVVTRTPIEIFRTTLKQLETLVLYAKYNGDIDKIAESLPSSSNRPHSVDSTLDSRHVRLHLANLRNANHYKKEASREPSNEELIETANRLELLSCFAITGLKVILNNIHRAPKNISSFEGKFEAELDLYDQYHAIGKKRRPNEKALE